MRPTPFRAFTLTCLLLVAVAVAGAGAKDHQHKDEKSSGQDQLADATVLIIRHADKPENGDGLSPAGEARAHEYVNYFEHYQIDGTPLKLQALFAAADSKASHRPLLTLEPLSRAIGLPIDSMYKDKDYEKLVGDLRSTGHGKDILVCWHHGEIPNLLRALGADAGQLIPGGEWPGDQYGWVVQLRFDGKGHVSEAKLVVEGF